MLDNPVWSALTTRQSHLALGDDRVKRYPADMAPFLATAGGRSADSTGFTGAASPSEARSMMAATEPSPPPGWEIERRSPIYQMLYQGIPGAVEMRADCSVLGPSDVPDMLKLTSLVFPGFFRPRTIELGTYFGIHSAGQLVAMAGQRTFLEGYREISGICTHPDHRGRGHARRLVTLLIDDILKQGITPFLHVNAENDGARRVYETLGFAVRAELTLLHIRPCE